MACGTKKPKTKPPVKTRTLDSFRKATVRLSKSTEDRLKASYTKRKTAKRSTKKAPKSEGTKVVAKLPSLKKPASTAKADQYVSRAEKWQRIWLSGTDERNRPHGIKAKIDSEGRPRLYATTVKESMPFDKILEVVRSSRKSPMITDIESNVHGTLVDRKIVISVIERRMKEQGGPPRKTDPGISKGSWDKINEAYNRRKRKTKKSDPSESDSDRVRDALEHVVRGPSWRFRDAGFTNANLRFTKSYAPGRFEFTAGKDHVRGAVYFKALGNDRVNALGIVTAKDGDVKTFSKSGDFGIWDLKLAEWFDGWAKAMCDTYEKYSFKAPRKKRTF